MLCLWNGEYEEHNLEEFYATKSGAEKNLERMEREYAKYPGTVIGDFTCIKVEYDWGRRDQRWTVKCNLCGEITYKYHAKDWIRGKGRSLVCKCRKEAKKAEKERIEKERKAKAEERKAKAEAKKIEKSKKGPFKTKYASDEWIGKRNGHLTAIGRDGSLFICRCDCGNELSVRPVELFTRKTKKCCGEPDCECSSIIHQKYQKRKKEGIAYEKEVEKQLIEKGYDAKVTKGVGDYGVDIIITNTDGSLIGVQCKKQTAPAGVEAIQEVYAGGRFYDCTKFAVVCDQGFSKQAIIMARKLGVYLCDGNFEMPNNIDEYTVSLLPTYRSFEKPKKPKKIKPQFTVSGFTGSFSEVCDHFGMVEQTVRYRMRKRGMTLEEAILTPTKFKDTGTE